MALSTRQYDEIMRIYDKQRDENRFLLDERIKFVYENVSGYQELDTEIITLSVSQAKKYLSGDDNAINESKEKLTKLSKAKTDLLVRANLPANYLEMKYKCPDCKDTGYIDQQKCHCLNHKIINLLYEQSGIREMIEKENFAHLEDYFFEGKDLVNFHKAVERCKLFCENFSYQNLCFYGTVGTGKSFLSGCIAKSILDQGYSVIYYSANDLFSALSRHLFEREMKDEINIYSCDLLVIDDLGTETNSEFLNSQLFNCLNVRHINRKSTIISTNLLLEDLSKRYTDRIFSRIFSHYDHLRLTGADIRMVKKLKAKRG